MASRRPVELEYSRRGAGSLKRFYAATYTHGGLYTQSVRFVSGNFGYTVFTRSRGVETVAAGVDVRDRKERQDDDDLLQRAAALLLSSELQRAGTLRSGNAGRDRLREMTR